MVLTFLGMRTVFMNKFFPAVADKLIKKFYFKEWRTGEIRTVALVFTKLKIGVTCNNLILIEQLDKLIFNVNANMFNNQC